MCVNDLDQMLKAQKQWKDYKCRCKKEGKTCCPLERKSLQIKLNIIFLSTILD